MYALKYFVYLCLFPASKVHSYRTVTSDGADIIVAEAGESVDIVCESEVPLVGCEFVHPEVADLLVFYNTTVESCNISVNATPANTGLWRGVCYTSSSSHPQVPQQNKMVDLRVVWADEENMEREGHSATLSYDSDADDQEDMGPASAAPDTELVGHGYNVTYASSHHDLAPISAAPGRQLAETEGDSVTLCENSQDDEPAVISVQTYVCANLAFLATFVALLYYKERHYSRHYGTSCDDDGDSIHEAKRAGDVKYSANPLVLVV